MARPRSGLAASLLRLRSDEQLVSLFRAGNEDAFRVIHDRYRTRIHAYARQMLSSAAGDAEDVVQEIFVRAYLGLRSNRRELALRAWLYRIAHNRCIDELRRPQAIAVEAVEELGESRHADPQARAEQREALQRLIDDVRRLPDQQRSALLMRELGGMPYADLSGALGVSVPAVKSLLVRARVGLVQASEARDTACAAIREDLIVAHDRGVRASGRARRHMRDCSHCRKFRTEVHGVSRRLGLLLPILGPAGAAAKLLGIGTLGGGGAAAGSSTGAAAGSTAAAAGSTAAAAGSTGAAAGGGLVAGGGAVAVGGGAVAVGTGAVAVGTGAVAAGGGALAAAGTGHVAAIIAATVVAAGSAMGIQQASTSPRPDVAVASVPAHATKTRDLALVASRPAALAAVPHRSGTTRNPAAPMPAFPVGGTSRPAARSSSRGSSAAVGGAGGGSVAGTGGTSNATGPGGGTTTTPAAPSTSQATVPAGSPTAGTPTVSAPAATTNGTTGSTGSAATTSATTGSTGSAATTGSAGPTSTAPATTTGSGAGASASEPGPSGSATATTPARTRTTASASPTTPLSAADAPTITSAATTTARGGHASGGSTIIPVLGGGRTAPLSARDRHLAVRGSRGGLFSVRVASR
jgi:RNA polymerase sigma factor (sigma-70 family)